MTKTIRIEYSLPADTRDPLGAWQPQEFTRFPTDRAEQDRRILVERAANAAAGRITRRPRGA